MQLQTFEIFNHLFDSFSKVFIFYINPPPLQDGKRKENEKEKEKEIEKGKETETGTETEKVKVKEKEN